MDPDDTHRSWAERSGEFSPAYYAEIGPNEVSETLADVLSYYAEESAAVLEVGCSSGRHLASLLHSGFGNLTGVDINDESFAVMAEYFPELAEAGTFHTGALEEVVPEFGDGQFDVVYSVETLQHIHPDNEWVFAELARVTSNLLVTAENEGNSPERGRRGNDVSCVRDDFPLYYRDWEAVFSELGLAQLVCEPGKRDTVRVFRVL